MSVLPCLLKNTCSATQFSDWSQRRCFTVSVFQLQAAGGRSRAAVGLHARSVGAVHGAEIRLDRSIGMKNNLKNIAV